MAHPNVQHAVAFCRGVVGNAVKQRSVAVGADLGRAKFTGFARFNLATQLLRHGLHAVANAQNRHAQLKHGLRRFVGFVLIHAGVAARQDDAFEIAVRRVGFDPIVTDTSQGCTSQNTCASRTRRAMSWVT